jgi:hypothetical protein
MGRIKAIIDKGGGDDLGENDSPRESGTVADGAAEARESGVGDDDWATDWVDDAADRTPDEGPDADQASDRYETPTNVEELEPNPYPVETPSGTEAEPPGIADPEPPPLDEDPA